LNILYQENIQTRGILKAAQNILIHRAIKNAAYRTFD